MLKELISKTKYDCRDYQERIISNAVAMFTGNYKRKDGTLEEAVRNVMIESPTGSGKTCMGLLTVSHLNQKLGDDVHYVWVAMRRNLLVQAETENLKMGVNARNLHFLSMFNSYPEEIMKLKEEGKKFAIILDECHHDAASSMTHLHNLIDPIHVLGLTATPFRTDKMKLCFEKVIKDAGIHQLIADGYLSQYDSYSIDSWSVENVVDCYLREPERWGKSVMFFLTLDECARAYRLLLDAGVRADFVTGTSDRDEQLKLFKEGDTQVLVNCMVLTEGFDEPSLRTAFVRDSGRGPTVQMAGRAFRKFGTERKIVVQSKHTHWPMMKTAMPHQQYVADGDGWKSLKVNDQIESIQQRVQQRIARIDVTLPKFLTSRKKKAKRNAVDRPSAE